MSAVRRSIFHNTKAESVLVPSSVLETDTEVYDFHRQLPGYSATPLVQLDQLAKELGVRAVFVKDETDRFGLPAFKILGASWGVFRAVAERLNVSPKTPFASLRNIVKGSGITLYSATDGNHGRAVARMGHLMDIAVQIHVPATMHTTTIQLIKSEGAEVVVSKGDYDNAVAEAKTASDHATQGLLVQDFAFEGYERIPQYIVDGYRTMMVEIDEQLEQARVDLIVAPVGVGSLAQAITSHYKAKGQAKVLTVEPDTATCLWKSLVRGEMTMQKTTPTILSGLECGTISTTAWPVLSAGVDASLTVSDFEAHTACLDLNKFGIAAGPCGGAPLAALRRLTASDKRRLNLTQESVVVIPCTEGMREYGVPMDVAVDDVIQLTQTLIRINSASPTLGLDPGPGEIQIACYIASWLAYRDIETHWIEESERRPSVVGVVKGSGGGRTLMFNGHIDTVTLAGYDGDALSGTIKNGRVYGRGAADMKSGLAAALIATSNSKSLNLRGDVVFAGVSDEEDRSLGTSDVLNAGWVADGAIVTEPTNLEILHAHKGFIWFEVNVEGNAAHGSRQDLGIDAIVNAGHFLAEIGQYSASLASRGLTPETCPSVHASTIKGGEESSSYPALCTIVLERRTIAGDTVQSVEQEIRQVLQNVAMRVSHFKYNLKATFDRPSFEVSVEDSFVAVAGDVISKALHRKPKFARGSFWTDCALLAEAGIPAILWGPTGDGLHSKEEWPDIDSIRHVADGLTLVAAKFCT
ncbi:acetylornithine deacetylase [Myriangium duriaei CBS 260.36]|uniref:Probable succinyl-diaminopimelate desuccinylase n=1 Tax=Myriangium duriaei CBS 260.36 TaxID=1168546 RepID=A0A9P4IZJ9_9PEZI|nr:acetylornithine deacetylase [Myriangium duriaei CBS 260.36]